MAIKKRALIYLPLLLIGSLLVWNYWGSDENEEIATKLYNSRCLDNRFDSFVKYLIDTTKTQMALKREVSINKPYDKEKINVYIINFSRLETLKNYPIGKFSEHEFTSFAKDNFIALPPNIIVIDEYYLSFLILNCFNESVNGLQVVDGLMGGSWVEYAQSPDEFLHTWNSIATYLCMGNYLQYKSKVKEISIDSLACNVIRNSEIFDDTSQVVGAVGFKKFHELYFYFFLPIISHELAHIQSAGAGGYGWKDIKGFNKYFDNFKAENEADKIAIQTIKKVHSQNSNGEFFIAFNAFSRVFKNIVLVETYSNFRSIKPNDLLVTIEQKDSLPQKFLILPFHYIQRVSKAFENVIPPMTEVEFNAFRNKLESSGSSIFHRHILLRCADFLDAIGEQRQKEMVFGPYLPLLSSTDFDKTIKSSLFVGHSNKKLDISRNQTLRYLKDKLNLVPAVNHSKNKIEIGLFKNNLGYVEFHGNPRNLSRIVLVLKTRDKDDNNEGEGIYNLAFFIRFFANLYDNKDEGMKMALYAHAKLRNENMNRPTFSVKCNNNTIKILSMNQSYFVRVEVMPTDNDSLLSQVSNISAGQ